MSFQSSLDAFEAPCIDVGQGHRSRRNQGIFTALDVTSCSFLFAACSGTSSRQKLPQPWHKHYSPTAAWPPLSKWGQGWAGPGQRVPIGTCPRTLPSHCSRRGGLACCLLHALLSILCPHHMSLAGDAGGTWCSGDAQAIWGSPAHCALFSLPVPLPWVPGPWAHTALACLSLQENAIGDEGMAALSTALKVNTTLSDLQ